ncbi:hypothetical protein FL583_17865 [Cryptosporangium phraense]|uniref:Uncharacterized protein n=1 Tax=Cryptosporangium phraense TaxID=2593070 RepID=A0A545ARI4_9ACTN|nr:hypothetical protein FL583_17865 [Cryptosporangium phraense]
MSVVTRAWITQILTGDPLGSECPDAWRTWCRSRAYRPIEAPRTLTVLSRNEQLPSGEELAYLLAIYEHFKPKPTDFERFAADVFKMSEPQVERADVTRPWRDGGHPVVIIARRDLVEILKSRGYDSLNALKLLLQSKYPVA